MVPSAKRHRTAARNALDAFIVVLSARNEILFTLNAFILVGADGECRFNV
jgi:hypothetical protein